MKSNLIITWKHNTLDIAGKEVYHNGSWRGGSLANKFNDTEERYTNRAERTSYHNVSKEGAEKILSKLNKKNIQFARWYDKDLMLSEIVYHNPSES